MNVGDEVRIKKDSVYYTLNGNSNPKVNGVITDIRENKQYCFKVLWDNKTTNSYRITDLEIVEYKPKKAKSNKIDPIVTSVMTQLLTRSQLGINKYNTTLQDNNTDDFLQHLKEELMDAILYIEKLQTQKNGSK